MYLKTSYNQYMRKILISLICFLSVCICTTAADYSTTTFPYDSNLVLDNNTYQKFDNEQYGCFEYTNYTNAKLFGKTFSKEISCVKYDKNTANLYIDGKSKYVFFIRNGESYITESNPYYFDNIKIQTDIIDFFLAIEKGGFSDRD